MDGWMDGGRNFSPRVYFCDHGSWFFSPQRSLLRGKETNVGNVGTMFIHFFLPLRQFRRNLSIFVLLFFFFRENLGKNLFLFFWNRN